MVIIVAPPQHQPAHSTAQSKLQTPGVKSTSDGTSAEDEPPQHRLYFFPLPQGQGVFRSGFIARSMVTEFQDNSHFLAQSFLRMLF
jgi:hypothetical protein